MPATEIWLNRPTCSRHAVSVDGGWQACYEQSLQKAECIRDHVFHTTCINQRPPQYFVCLLTDPSGSGAPTTEIMWEATKWSEEKRNSSQNLSIPESLEEPLVVLYLHDQVSQVLGCRWGLQGHMSSEINRTWIGGEIIQSTSGTTSNPLLWLMGQR